MLLRPRQFVVSCALVLAACGGQTPPAADSIAASADSIVIDTTAADSATGASDSATARVVRARLPGRRALSPVADSIAQRLVFVPATQTIFLVAGRAKHMLVDIGRVDVSVSRPASRLAAYKEAVVAGSPIAVGTRLRLRGPWGADDVEVSGFDVWNGRIVATIKGAPRVDSLARRIDPLTAVAVRADSASPPVDTPCVRDSVDTLLDRRIAVLRDSVLQLLHQGDQPIYPRLLASIKEHSSRVVGCFPSARALLVVSLVAGDYEWVRERALLVGTDGKVRQLSVRDLRFRAHDLLGALDADGDSVDEVAALAHTERAGGTVVLRIADDKRLERVIAGFSWER